MKKRLFAFILITFCLKGFAQTSILLSNYGTATTLAPNEIILISTQAASNTKVTIDIKNISASTKSYIAKRYDVLLNSDATSTAQAYFCIAGSCYGPPTLISPTPLTLTSMQSASELQGSYQMLVADLDEVSTVGLSLVKYTFQNVNDPNDSLQVSIKYNAPVVTGIKTQSPNLESFEMSPNPTTEILNLNFTSTLNFTSKVSVYNNLGMAIVVREISIEEGINNISLNLSELSSGVYFLNFDDGSFTKTKRFIVE